MDDFNYISRELQGYHSEKNEDSEISSHLGYTHVRCYRCGRVFIVARAYMAAYPEKKITCGGKNCQK